MRLRGIPVSLYFAKRSIFEFHKHIFMFSEKDKEQISRHGADISTIEQQIQRFKEGFPYADITEAAGISNGIFRFDDAHVKELEKKFDALSAGRQVVKFSPASGAASRMFSALFAFRALYHDDPAELPSLQADKALQPVFSFIEQITRFAFYDQLKSRLAADGHDIEDLLTKKSFNTIIDYLLTEKGLGYASLPKALLGFHKYENSVRTAAEEHLIEAAHYCRNSNSETHIHFTLSPEHIDAFEGLMAKVLPEYERSAGTKFIITHSIQKPSTDTIAVDMEYRPFRDDDSSLVFRPGGHGALISNLGDIDADIAFIKNIDNIVPDRLKAETYRYKKVIGGLLMAMQEKVNNFLRILSSNALLPAETIHEISDFCGNELMIRFMDEYHKFDDAGKCACLFSKLNRPMRVCGMVKNEGEPGGGPFWVRNSKGEISLQIIESSQIDLKDVQKKKIFETATHFNPVDLVCSLKDFRGKRFDLQQFIDPATGFISVKTHNGRQLKAQELPGLWNGAMADWITLFVEVPVITFNPVKTVNDLLRAEHR
jgi:hypothetical protein